MFKRSHPRRLEDHARGTVAAPCPKCGYTEVVGDSCSRCRVKVSTYRIHLATLSEEGAFVSRAKARKGGWFKKVFMIAPRNPAAPSARHPSRYEQLLLTRLYRELQYPTTTRGIYVVLLAFDLTTAGRPSAVRLAVYPPNHDVGASVRAALNRAQPFPLPPPDGRGRRKDQRISLALTVSI